MGKKWIYGVAASALLAVLSAGCGDGSEELSAMNSIDVVEPIDLGSEMASGEESGEVGGTAEPVSAGETAAPVQENGLSYGTGDLSPEAEAAVLEAMTTLQQNLELPEYVGEGIHMVSSREWFDSMAQGLYEGSRNYVLRSASGVLSAQIGLDVEDEPYVNIYYQAGEGDILLLKQAKDVTWLLRTTLSGGKYEGAFDKWRIESKTGHILREQGTYSGGVIVGEYKKSEYTGSAGEAFDLWTNRENFTYKTTVVHYDENGEVMVTPAHTATPKPANTATQKPPATKAPTQAPTQAPPQPTPEPPQEPEPPQQPEPPQPTPEPPQPTPEPPQPTPEPPQPTLAPPQPTPEPPQEPSVGDTDIGWSPDLDV